VDESDREPIPEQNTAAAAWEAFGADWPVSTRFKPSPTYVVKTEDSLRVHESFTVATPKKNSSGPGTCQDESPDDF
jgi:hypothetical protein